MLTIAGLSAAIPILSATTPLASAQSVTGSFNPQTQFPVGSSIKITSVYGIAMVPLHPEPNGPMPPFRNQTIQHNPPSRNQTNPLHHQTNGTRPAWNRTGQHVPPWNQTGQQYSTVYSASITINAQVTNDTRNGVQWTIQGGSIIVNGTTFTITGGKGRMSNNDLLMMYGNATDSSGHTIRWDLEGLAAIYKGTVIIELNGRSFSEMNNPAFTRDKGFTDVSLSYIATID